jgi:penicillin amidase
LFLGNLLPIIENTTDWNNMEEQALNLLTSWNYEMTPEKAAASVCELWSYYIIKEVYEDEMGNDLFGEFIGTDNLPRIALANLLQDFNQVWIDNILTEEVEDMEAIAIESFRKTVDELVSKQGRDTTHWRWGNIQGLTLKHPLAKVDALNKVFKLNRGPYAVGGSYHTISQNKFPWFKPGEVNWGSSHRSIYDLSDWDQTISVIPTGTSGIPSSKFYCDQTEMFMNGEYHSDLFSEEIINEQAQFTAIYFPE